MTHFADDATLARLAALEAVASNMAGLARASGPAWWGHWSAFDLGGLRFVVCDCCGRHGLPGGGPETVAHKDCHAERVDAALARLRALDAKEDDHAD